MWTCTPGLRGLDGKGSNTERVLDFACHLSYSSLFTAFRSVTSQTNAALRCSATSITRSPERNLPVRLTPESQLEHSVHLYLTAAARSPISLPPPDWSTQERGIFHDTAIFQQHSRNLAA